ncbi:hypothetical protein [Janthinobacterium sp. K2E3]|uniref:hypothetical protein n=1 Tax=Janthinobacterium sp. K2E3 TaxID=2723082 RepID=UPI0017CF26AF|nr:hypothetical protein [Janthinobacterium sp. K2E3]MBB5370082.1 hypothetical protein [Janthinobacterium sp. K2C7]MBB5382888.1 hypothetical protein [Janthinobacterium sp. K2Li3]MBB5384873.1 hypothetical protein [Janthinobacterium sp. K2E3]
MSFIDINDRLRLQDYLAIKLIIHYVNLMAKNGITPSSSLAQKQCHLRSHAAIFQSGKSVGMHAGMADIEDGRAIKNPSLFKNRKGEIIRPWLRLVSFSHRVSHASQRYKTYMRHLSHLFGSTLHEIYFAYYFECCGCRYRGLRHYSICQYAGRPGCRCGHEADA